MAEAFGLEADETGRYARGLSYHFVFNTVPAPVLTQDQLAAFCPAACWWSWPLRQAVSRPARGRMSLASTRRACPEDSVPGAGAAYAAAILEQEGRSQHGTDCRLCPVRLVLHIPKGH